MEATHMEATHSFGYLVRRRRKALDLSQRQLAEKVAYSLSAIKKVEQDMRRPSRELAESLAEVLAVPEADREQFLETARGLAPVDTLPLADQPLEAPLLPRLPAPVGRLFGRDRELERLKWGICDPGEHLVTLVGPGGVGKSRLALEAAHQVRDHFPDGCWFVPLAGVSDPANLSTAIAITLSLTFAGPGDPEEQLIRLLQDRHLLILLDNFEQLLPAGAPVIASIVESVPTITLLVTSRERLRLRAETTIAILGLSQAAAVDLFSEQAQRVGAEWLISPSKAGHQAIAGICTLLGGLPLAVELAAAWAHILTPDEILSELTNDLDLLKSDFHDLPDRHRSIETVIAASWDRLPQEGQKLLAGLSVFAGSFTREAIESICEASLPQIAMLQDHSLLQRAGGRFSLHELIHHFAAGKLNDIPADKDQIQDRHSAFYAGLLSQVSALFKNGRPELTGWERLIEREMDNIHLAWDWAVSSDQPERLLPATLALFQYFDLRGQGRMGSQMLAALDKSAADVLAAGSGDDLLLRRTRAKALSIIGYLSLQFGQFAQAQEQLEQFESLLEGLDAPDEWVEAIAFLGAITMMTADYSESQKRITVLSNIARREGHVYGQALALNFLGLIHLRHGQPEKAQEALTGAVNIWSQHPGLAFCKLRSMVHLGLTYHAHGDYENAIQIQEGALALARELRDDGFAPLAICNLAFHHFGQGDLILAKAGFLQGLAAGRQIRTIMHIMHGLLGLGLVAAAENQAERAVILLTFAAAQPGPGSIFLLGEPQRVLQELRSKLPPAEFSAAEAQAREMELDDLLAWL